MAKFENILVGKGGGASESLYTEKNYTIAPYTLRTIDDSISSHSEIPPYKLSQQINLSWECGIFSVGLSLFLVNVIKGGDPN
jgi:hypothetical protein